MTARAISLAALIVLAGASMSSADEMPMSVAADAPPIFSMVRADFDGAQSRGLGLFNWDVEAWYGGDTDKLWLTSQGLLRGDALDDGEAQALWSRNIADYWDFQGGVRGDFAPTGRTYAVLGFEGLAPYFFETQAHMFVSDRGDVSARLKQWIDLPVTQRLFIEPHAQVDLAVQNVPDERVGAGLTDIELAIQTRYELSRKFAPYLDLVWSKAFANTADYYRLNHEPPDELTLRAGIRFWF